MRIIPHDRASALISSLCLVSLAYADLVYIQPVAYAAAAARRDDPVARRDDACPANYFSCSSQGSAFAGICCASGQLCALDTSNSAACCPSGAVCTGAAPSTLTGTVTQVSYISNSLFVFPAIATSFSNAAACSAAYSSCSANYAACTSDLASGTGGYGVTVNVPGGGGVTVQPTHTQLDVASATSVCSSLESAACHGLSSARCSSTGSGDGFTIGGSGNAAGPMITVAPIAAMAGVGFGMLGALI
ncbi:hypothetical protein BJ170DRAFT_601075 [Xylariales sp. AK1849]|nr:hypothetical protein BJ170DRAFT_601075 [Xylariales sp. AK1849]